MNNDRDLMQEALDALESLQAWPETPENFKRFRAIEALRARIAQPEQEPVAWRFHDRNMWCYVDHLTDLPQDKFKPLYTAPPQREWVGLTDEEIRKGNRESWVTTQAWKSAVWWAEAKLKEKNNG